jgi:hypothetical protein
MQIAQVLLEKFGKTIDILQKPLTMGEYAHPFKREKASVEEGESGKSQQWSVYRHFQFQI